MNRYTKGLENLSKIDGRAGEEVVRSIHEVFPDFAKFLVEYPFGDIYERKELLLREREIATIASLITQGDAQPQLAVHIVAGLNVGLTKAEIYEIILQMSVYCGFPKAINALNTANKVIKEYQNEY